MSSSSSSSAAREIIDVEGAPLVRRNAMIASEATEVAGQYKLWVMTANNPTNTAEALYTGINNRVKVKYAAMVKEKGDSGTPHYQIYLETLTKQRFTTMKNKLRPLGLWLEPCRGGEKGRDYVMRTGDHADKPGLLEGPWEFGDYEKKQGQRTDLEATATMIMAGASLRRVAEASPSTYIKFHGGIKALHQVIGSKRRSFMTELHIITGVPGSGKSHTAAAEAEKYLVDNNLDGEVYYWSPPAKLNDKVWFNGYDGQHAMVINDFYGTMDIDMFKNLIDKYPYRVEVKNGSVEFLAKAVWVTSNTAWSNWWGDKLLSNINNRAAIQRRITSERTFDQVYVPDDIQLPAPRVYLNDQPIPINDPVFQPFQGHDDLDLMCHEQLDPDLFNDEEEDDRICRRVAQMRSDF